MNKQILKCVCPLCDEEFELEADMLIPGVEGIINRPDRTVTILDPTKTERHCRICGELLTRSLIDEDQHLEVADE